MPGPHIALINDDTAFLELMRDLLEADDGYQVSICNERDGAYEFVKRMKPDLVIQEHHHRRRRKGWTIPNLLTLVTRRGRSRSSSARPPSSRSTSTSRCSSDARARARPTRHSDTLSPAATRGEEGEPMLSTRFTELVGCAVPIQQAGMGAAAPPELAAAVSNAGGLGMIGAAQIGLNPTTLGHRLDRAHALTAQPFGVNFIVTEPVEPSDYALFQLAALRPDRKS